MFGSDQINKALVREFKLTYAQAEQWKRDPTLAPSIGQYYETLQSIYDIYVEETLELAGRLSKSAFPAKNSRGSSAAAADSPPTICRAISSGESGAGFAWLDPGD